MCVSIRHPECQVVQVGHALLVLGYDIFIPADLCLISPASRLLLFVWSPGCNELDPSQHVILLDCPTHGHFFSVCYIFLSDTHSQYEHTEGLLTDKCNMLGKSCLN